METVRKKSNKNVRNEKHSNRDAEWFPWAHDIAQERVSVLDNMSMKVIQLKVIEGKTEK